MSLGTVLFGTPMRLLNKPTVALAPPVDNVFDKLSVNRGDSI